MKDENRKKKALTVVYEVGESLYVNITNRCTNRCDFCIRNNGDGAYGSDPLWLEREPSAEEIIRAIEERNPEKYQELVFCGYGEPSCRLPVAREVALAIKGVHPDVKIRINTNGQSDLIFGEDTAPLYKDAFDTVSVSLNAPSAKRYQQICHSVYGEGAFDAILTFVKRVKDFAPSVQFSVVDEFIDGGEIAECRRIAEECGVSLRVRSYISAPDKSE